MNLQNNPIEPIDPLAMDLTDKGYGTVIENDVKRYTDKNGINHDIEITSAIHPHRRINPNTLTLHKKP